MDVSSLVNYLFANINLSSPRVEFSFWICFVIRVYILFSWITIIYPLIFFHSFLECERMASECMRGGAFGTQMMTLFRKSTVKQT
jgi:hypothetical protein